MSLNSASTWFIGIVYLHLILINCAYNCACRCNALHKIINLVEKELKDGDGGHRDIIKTLDMRNTIARAKEHYYEPISALFWPKRDFNSAIIYEKEGEKTHILREICK